MGAKLAASTIASPSSSADVRPEHSRFDVTTVTHVITDTLKFPEYEAVEREREQRLEKSKGDGFDQTHEELVQGPWTVTVSALHTELLLAVSFSHDVSPSTHSSAFMGDAIIRSPSL